MARCSTYFWVNKPIDSSPAFLWCQYLGRIGYETFGTCINLAGQDLAYSYGMYECTDSVAIMNYYDSETCTGDVTESVEISNSTCSDGDTFSSNSRCITEGEGASRRKYLDEVQGLLYMFSSGLRMTIHNQIFSRLETTPQCVFYFSRSHGAVRCGLCLFRKSCGAVRCGYPSNRCFLRCC